MLVIKKAVLLFLLLSVTILAQQPQSLEQILRLRPGNFWIYRGTVEWVDGSRKSGTATKQITWKSEIMEESVHGPLKAFLVHGSVADLPWYEPGTKPGDYLWIIYQDSFYEVTAEPGVIKRFHNPSDPLLDLVDAEEPLIQLPLRQRVCTVVLNPKEREEPRADLMYCWHFEDKQQQAIHVKGVPSQTAEEWQLWYRTNPDHQIFSLVPGIGFSAYDFSHHGTVSEAHVKLIEAHLQ
jgi:hypothetical protein